MSASCPHCGKPVPPSALGGLCPECMLDVGASAPTGEVAPGGTVPMNPPPSPPPAPDDLAPHFPHLEIMECLGRGGMGAVYRARQPKLDRLVALKILLPRPSTTGPDTGFTERFQREARALAQLNHPNIVGVHDFGEAGGYHYLVMEFVDGLNLRQMIRERKMKPEEALAIVPHICEALQYAHEQGVIHRDIKPENILIDSRGQLKIADFGIAKILNQQPGQEALTQERDVMGTPHYMAPEQVEQPLTVDHRADIYSLGVVFYEMLTGELPLGKFPPPSRKVNVDVRLDEVVLHALEKEPGRRYQHASDVKTDIESITDGPPAAPASSAAHHDDMGALRHRVLVFSMVICLVGLPAGMLMDLPVVWVLSIVGLVVGTLKLTGRWPWPSPLFGTPSPARVAPGAPGTDPLTHNQMFVLYVGFACCVVGLGFALMPGLPAGPRIYVLVLSIVGLGLITPAIVLRRRILMPRRPDGPPRPPPAGHSDPAGHHRGHPCQRRGCLYWVVTLLLIGVGLFLLIPVGSIVLSIVIPALQRAKLDVETTPRMVETAPAAAVIGKPTWGPVYEVTLPGEGHAAKRFLDLDTGDTFAAAEFFGPDVELGPETTRAWGRESGVDLMPNVNGPGSLTGVDLVAIPVSGASWTNLGNDLPHHLTSVVPEPLPMMQYDPDYPATYAFRTREGRTGLLRITAFDKDPSRPSITLQYKLVVSRDSR